MGCCEVERRGQRTSGGYEALGGESRSWTSLEVEEVLGAGQSWGGPGYCSRYSVMGEDCDIVVYILKLDGQVRLIGYRLASIV